MLGGLHANFGLKCLFNFTIYGIKTMIRSQFFTIFCYEVTFEFKDYTNNVNFFLQSFITIKSDWIYVKKNYIIN